MTNEQFERIIVDQADTIDRLHNQSDGLQTTNRVLATDLADRDRTIAAWRDTHAKDSTKIAELENILRLKNIQIEQLEDIQNSRIEQSDPY